MWVWVMEAVKKVLDGPASNSYEDVLAYLKTKVSKERYTSMSSVCSFGLIYPDPYGKKGGYAYDYTSGYACHAMVSRCTVAEHRALISTFWLTEDYGLTKEIYTEYCHFLLSDESPYASLFEKAKPTVIYYSVNKNLPWGFVLEGEVGNLSTQVTVNLCIAARQAYEHPYVVVSWKKFVDAGFTKREAFLLCFYWNVEYQTGKITYVNNLGHIHHDGAAWSVDHKAVLNAKPAWRKDMVFKNSGNYSPCNAVWYRGKEHEYGAAGRAFPGHPWFKKVADRATELNGGKVDKHVYDGMFKQDHNEYLNWQRANLEVEVKYLPPNVLDVALQLRGELYE